MDRQKTVPPLSTKITRKLAQESVDHNNLMNFYSQISRDETGAPKKWKMSSVPINENAITGAKGNASSSKDNPGEQKCKFSAGIVNRALNNLKKGMLMHESSSHDLNKSLDSLSEKTEKGRSSSCDAFGKGDNSVENKLKDKSGKGRRSVSAENVKKGKSIETLEPLAVKKKRGRPKSLDLSFSKAVSNGDDESFKSPDPLTPCNIAVKRRKGRPKETPPTLVAESPVEQNNLDENESDSEMIMNEGEIAQKKKSGRTKKSEPPVLDDAEFVSEMVDQNDTTQKKKSGRPRKIMPLISNSIETVLDNIEDTEVIQKRKPGRPPRKSETAGNLTVGSAVSDEIVKKKKPGRQPKSLEKAVQSDIDDNNLLGKKKGRPPKNGPGTLIQKKIFSVKKYENMGLKKFGSNLLKKGTVFKGYKRLTHLKKIKVSVSTEQFGQRNNTLDVHVSSSDNADRTVGVNQKEKKKIGRPPGAKNRKVTLPLAKKKTARHMSKKQKLDLKVKRKSGRPPGSKNKQKMVTLPLADANVTSNIHEKTAMNIEDCDQSLEMDIADEKLENETEMTPQSEKLLEETIDTVIKNARKIDIAEKFARVKDSLRFESLKDKGGVKSVAKQKKETNIARVASKKRILMSHASNSDSVASIAHLATNDLRRKLHKKLIAKLSGNRATKPDISISPPVDCDLNLDNVNVERNELNIENKKATVVSETVENISKGSETDIQNLSALIEQKRVNKSDIDTTSEPKKKIGRPRKSSIDQKDVSKMSDTESICSEVSTLSAHSLGSSKRPFEKHILVLGEDNMDSDDNAVRTRQRFEIIPGKKRKRTLSGEFDLLDEKQLRKERKFAEKETSADDADEIQNYEEMTEVKQRKQFKRTPKLKMKQGRMEKIYSSSFRTAHRMKLLKQSLLKPSPSPYLSRIRKKRNALWQQVNKLSDELKNKSVENTVSLELNIDENKEFETKSVDEVVKTEKEPEKVGDCNTCGISVKNQDGCEIGILTIERDGHTNLGETEKKLSVQKDDKNVLLFESENTALSEVKKTDEKSNIHANSCENDMKEPINEIEQLTFESKVSEGLKVERANENVDKVVKEKVNNLQEIKIILENQENVDTVKENFEKENDQVLNNEKTIETVSNIEENYIENDVNKEKTIETMSNTENNDTEKDINSGKTIETVSNIEENDIEKNVKMILMDLIGKVVNGNTTQTTEMSDGASVDEFEKNYDNVDSKVEMVPETQLKTKRIYRRKKKRGPKPKIQRKDVEDKSTKMKPVARKTKTSPGKDSPESGIVRKFELRQKISRSPLDNIALKQSIEENEYIKIEAQKAIRKEAKLRSRQAAAISNQEVVEELASLVDEVTDIERNEILMSDSVEVPITTNETTDSEISETDELHDIVIESKIKTIEEMKKECKPCSVIVTDFIKQLQLNHSKLVQDDDTDTSSEDAGSDKEAAPSPPEDSSLENQEIVITATSEASTTDIPSINSPQKESTTTATNKQIPEITVETVKPNSSNILTTEQQVTKTGLTLKKSPIRIGPASFGKKLREKPLIRTEPSEQQTARKTVPPLKIKVRGSRKKTYMVEPSVEFTLTSKPDKRKSRGKSGNKSESSDSEKHVKGHHHHHNKRRKSPTSNMVLDKQTGQVPVHVAATQPEAMKKSPIPTDAYEANFLQFIQSKDKNEEVLPLSNNANSKCKAYKVDADGSFIVTALVSSGTTTTTNSDKLLAPIANSGYINTSISEDIIKKSITDIDEMNLTDISEKLLKPSLTETQYICSYCEKTYQSGESILNHLKEMHPGDKIMYKHVADQLDEKDRSGHGNIFDRISELFSPEEAQQLKKYPSQMGKTSAEADSTTEIEAEEAARSNDGSGDRNAMNATVSESNMVVLEKEHAINSLGVSHNEGQTVVEDVCEDDDDNESSGSLNLKIVEVVSLKDQISALDESENTEKMDATSHFPVHPNVSQNTHCKSHELRIPHYPRSTGSPSVSIQDQINKQRQIFQQKKQQQQVEAIIASRKNATSSMRESNTFKCEKCNVHAPLLAAMVAHLRNCHKEIPRLFQCPYCRDMEAENEAKIHQHIRQLHPTDNPNPPVALSEPAKRNLKTLSVKLPDQVKPGDGNLIEKDIYMCLKCKVHMPSLEMIYAHLEHEHTEVFVFVCPFCKTFKSKSEEIVNRHLMVDHQRSNTDINISLAIDGNQFIRVPCLIKDKNKSAHKMAHSVQSPKSVPNQISPKVRTPQIPTQQQQQQQKIPIQLQSYIPVQDPNFRVSQASPIGSQAATLAHNTAIPQNNPPKTLSQTRPGSTGTKKKKSLLDSIQQLTIQKQMEQQGLLNTSSPSSTAVPSHPAQLNQPLSTNAPPPLIRGPPPLIRYDQLGKVPTQFSVASSVGQPSRGSTPFGNQVAVSAAQRLQSLNNPNVSQSSSTPKQIQSSLFDTSDLDAFKPVNRKPVLNVPTVPRANRVPFHHNMATPLPSQTSNSGDVVLDLSKTTPSASPIPQNLQSPPPQGSTLPVPPPTTGINPEVFKVFNLKPTTQAQLPRGPTPILGSVPQLGQQIMIPQQVRPNTTSTLAYRPPIPHVTTSQAPQVINMPMGAFIGNMVVSIPNSGLPQGFQALQGVTAVPGSQFIRMSVPQQAIPQAQALQSPRPGLVMAQPRAQALTVVGPPNQQIMNLNLPMFKCPYCPKIIPLTLAEVQPHIESQHHGSSIVFTHIDNQ